MSSKLHTDVGPGGKNFNNKSGNADFNKSLSYKTHSCHLPKQAHTMAQVC